MKVIAHRGACMEALENSWTAFELAVVCGAERIELDVQLTADDSLVVMHDESLRRTAGHDGQLSKLTRSELTQHRLLNDEPIPFLDEVVERLAPRIELNIEIKGASTVAADEVGKIVRRFQACDQVVVSSFAREPLEYLAVNYPEIPRACLWGNVLYWPNIAHFSPPVFMSVAQSRIFHPWVKYLTPEVANWAKSKGWTIFAYAGRADEAEDKEGLWSYLQAMGVDGLCTNYPREMRAWLATNQSEEDRIEHSRKLLAQVRS